MSVSDETILFNTNVDEGENRQAAMILQARRLISGIERDELVEELVRFYVKHKGL